MKTIKEYKLKLKKVISKLEKFDQDKLDYDYKVLKKAFNISYKAGLFNLHNIPKNDQDLFKFELFLNLTKLSGTLSFLSIQILAANGIMNINHFKRKEIYYKKKCGIAINHLRAPITFVNAKRHCNGYRLTGKLNWASGYKIFDTLLIGFHCDGLELQCIAPFKRDQGFIIGDPEKTFVGSSLHTVDIYLKDFFVKDKNIVSSQPIGNYTLQKSLSKTVHYCMYTLGKACLKEIMDPKFLQIAKKRLHYLKNDMLNSTDPDKLDLLRVQLFLEVQDIITTTLILNGGKSILSNQNIQRYYRELIMFNANGLNNNLKSTYKERYLNN